MSDVSRRTILGGAVGALAVGALFGPARAIAVPGAREWTGLDSSIDGDVVLPANGAEYQAVKRVFNSNYDGSTPVAVVTVKSQSDIQKTIAFAGSLSRSFFPLAIAVWKVKVPSDAVPGSLPVPPEV